jgi:hypothetical protein
MLETHALEWIVAVVQSPGGDDVVVWYEPATDLVVDIRVTRSAVDDAGALFEQVTTQPKVGEPRTPTRLRVADEVLAGALRRQVRGVEVVVGDISDAREMLMALGEYVSRMPAESAVDSGVWARMFDAAAAFYRARPWNVIPEDSWIRVDCDALEIAGGALSVVGQGGTSLGFTLCRSVEDTTAWLNAGECRVLGKPARYPAEFFMFGYNRRQDLDPEDVAEVKRQGWKLAGPAAYPTLTVVDHGEGRLPSEQEVAGITVLLEAMTAMVRDEPDLAAAWDGDPVEWVSDVAGSRVCLAAPLDVPDPLPDPEDATIDVLGEDGRADPLRVDRYRTALMMRLARREEIPDEVLAAAEMLVDFAAEYHGVTFARISVEQLHELLLVTIPAQLAVESSEATRIITAARELMRFAGDELGSRSAAAAIALLDAGFEQRLARALEDPTLFSTGKQLVMAGITAGYDMSSEEGVAEFVEAFARAQRAPRLKPRRKAKPRAKARPASKARPRKTAPRKR